jgi:tetratricopeptide (TPR) repeat protein
MNAAKEMTTRGWAHYWLGRFYHELMDYDKAIAHIKIAQAMGFKPLESKVFLGWAYIEAKSYNDADQSFRDAVIEANKQRRKVGSAAARADAPGEEDTINDLLVQILLSWARCYAKRGTNLKQAFRRAHAANRLIPSTTPSNRQNYQANYHSYLGWIQFMSGDIRQAVKELEQAVALSVDGEAYYHLAEAYFALAQGAVSGRAQWIGKAHDACVHAREADLRGVYRQEIADLQQRLAELANENSVKSTIAGIESVIGLSRDAKSDTERGSNSVGGRRARS